MFRADGYSELTHGFQLALEVSGLRPTTIKHYTTDAKKFLEHYSGGPPSEITPLHIRQHLALLKNRVSAKTVYEVQLALRKFFRFLVKEDARGVHLHHAVPALEARVLDHVALGYAGVVHQDVEPAVPSLDVLDHLWPGMLLGHV